MGLRLSTTIVDPKVKPEINEINKQINCEIVESDELSPNDLHIGLINGKIIINNEELQSILDDTPNLTKFDKSINNLYPNCEIVHILQYDTAGLIGYVIIDEGEKQRCKAIIDQKLFLDDNKVTAFEESSANSILKALSELSPKSKNIIDDKIKGLSKNQIVKFAFNLYGKFTKQDSKYLTGELDYEFVDKLFPYFIDGDWSKLIDIKYARYKNVNYQNMEYELSDYVQNSINELKKVSI